VCLSNSVRLINGNARQFERWAKESALVTESWRIDILEVIQDSRRSETAADWSSGGASRVEDTSSARSEESSTTETTPTVAEWDKANKYL